MTSKKKDYLTGMERGFQNGVIWSSQFLVNRAANYFKGNNDTMANELRRLAKELTDEGAKLVKP